MKHVMLAGLVACVLGMSVACGSAPVPLALLVETGCVTASGNEFILTDLEEEGRATPRPTTDAFLLIGAEAQLKAQVDHRVRVTGDVDPAKVIDIRMLQPKVRARQGKNAEESGAHVDVGEQLRLEVSHLRVQSVEPTGEQCVGQ